MLGFNVSMYFFFYTLTLLIYPVLGFLQIITGLLYLFNMWMFWHIQEINFEEMKNKYISKLDFYVTIVTYYPVFLISFGIMQYIKSKFKN